MTKLIEWLVVCGSILAVWAAIITNRIDTSFTKQYMYLIIPSPLIFLVMFGIYATTVVLYRVFTFNNCEDAAIELRKEIEVAKGDLKTKGLVF